MTLHTSDRMRQYVQYGLTALFFLLTFLMLCRPIVNADIWWHLTTGKYIIAHKAIPYQDVFSYTVPGREWIDLSWLFQVIIFTLYHYCGLYSLIVFKIMVGMIVFALLFRAGYSRHTYLISIGVFIGVLFSAHYRFLLRPELLTFLYCSLYLYIVNRFKYSGKTKALFLLPLIQVLWVNSHSLFILGVIIMVCFWCAETITLITRGKVFVSPPLLSQKDYIITTVVTGLVIAVNIINPYGLKGVLFLGELYYRISGSSSIFQNIGEFQPIWGAIHHGYMGWSFYALLSIVIISFIINVKRINLFRLFLFIIFFFLATKAVRNVALWALISGYVALGNSNSFFSHNKHSRMVHGFISHSVVHYVLGIGVFGMILFSSLQVALPYGGRGQYGFFLQSNTIPIHAMAFIRNTHISGNMFNFSLGVGNYFLWEFWPERKVFTDGRLEVYDEAFYREYLAAMSNEDAWRRIVEKYDINFCLLDHTRSFYIVNDVLKKKYNDFLLRRIRDNEWKLVHIDPLSVIFVKNTARNADIIKRFFIDVETQDKHNTAVPRDEENDFFEKEFLTLSYFYSTIYCFNTAEHILDRGLIQYPHSIILRHAQANMYLQSGDTESAEDIFQALITLKKDCAPAYASLGKIYCDKGESDTALRFYKKAQWYGIQSSQFDLLIGDVHRLKGNFLRAQWYYKKAMWKDPQSAYAYNNLGSLYAEGGQFDKARHCWEKTLVLDPENDAARSNLLRLNGNEEKAQAIDNK